ncbi:putative N-acetyltransferase YjaB [Sporomusa ovata DSM 2662]|uniref:Histone acetyltransferase HPA2 and related acetyltransferases n=1 Tax=Sporomusa ovata TaxID=2378 RepID=A0A0U1KSF0_9FIRM|nr:GNAT family N-acetyltransferase [Sporomusa ovata]EQB26280.1 acetyltransferase, GNAT family [Sporomusa ovata DSM 2662]CQR70356.1 Histone acetyltransferase HPA2 and related acetyltransferases [Sporomusa ovata]
MITQPSVNDYETLINIWEDSVRSTHDFLKEEDIQFYKPLILNKYFHKVNLFCHKDKSLKITGFMGIVDDKLEMLFIDSNERGKRIGKRLLIYAMDKQKVKRVDVNEQNDQAVGFYKHMGFHVVNRSEFDGAGKHYPILHMELDRIATLLHGL